MSTRELMRPSGISGLAPCPEQLFSSAQLLEPFYHPTPPETHTSYILKTREPRAGSAWRVPMIEGLLQPSHLLIILVVALFIFGPKKLPELGQGLGKGIRSFRDSMKAGSEEPDKVETPPSKPTDTPK